MATQYLDKNGLLYFWQLIKGNATPLEDGSASVGTAKRFALQDHVHPHDSTKVDKVSGKGLSTNDFTTAEKDKLSGIASGAEVNVQADWNETDTASDAYIKNKPTIPEGATVDDAMSSTSENPVQNKVIYTALQGKAGTAPFGGATTSRAGSSGLVPAPSASTNVNTTVLCANGDWEHVQIVSNVDNGARRVGVRVGSTTNYATVGEASSSANGFMSIADKVKLDSVTITNGIIDASNLPSYIDDVIEAYPRSGATELSASWLSLTSGGAALTPETGKIYVLMADSTNYSANSQFRWGGSAYVKLSDGGVSSITNAEIDTIVAS